MEKSKGSVEKVFNRIGLIQEAKGLLKKEGYYIDNLWHIDDVKQNYDCTDNDAYKILDQSIAGEYTQEQIFIAIDEVAFAFDIPLKKTEDETTDI